MNSDLSDNQKRFICRVLFLAVCALPTCVTIYLATHKQTPDQWAQILQAELGVETSIGVVETLRPGEYVFRDVRLFDNHGETIFQSLVANMVVGDINRIHFPGSVRIQRNALSHFLDEATERLVKPNAGTRLWKVDFDDIEIEPEGFERRGFEFGRLEISCHNESGGRVVTLASPLIGENGQPLGGSCRLNVVRNQLGAYSVNFDTTEHVPVPCWLVKHWFPNLEKKLGSQASFSGSGTINYSGPTTSCENLTGIFNNVRLPKIAGIDTENVSSIHANGVRLDDSGWTFGEAGLQYVDRSFRVMSRAGYNRPLLSRQPDAFTEAIRTAKHEDLRATAIY